MGVLRNANYRTLFIGQLVSTYGNNLYALALPWYIYTVTNSKLDLTVVGFADYVPALAGFFVGVLVDRWRKRSVMLASDAIRTLLALCICAVVALHGTFLTIFTIALFIQFAGSFFSPAAGALTPLLVSKEELPQAMGLSQSGNGVVELTGMVSGGAFLALFKTSLLFLTDALTFAVSIVSLLLIHVHEDVAPRSTRKGYGHEWREGFRALIKSQSILQIFLGGLITNFGLAPAMIVLTAWVKGPMGGSAATYGIVAASIVVGAIGGGMLLGRVTKWIAPKRLLQSGLMVLGVCLGLIALWANAYWCMAMLIVAGFAISSLNGSLEVLLVAVVPQAMRGRIFGMFNGVMVLASPLGLAVFGVLLVTVPLAVVWLAMGGLSVLGGMAYFLPVRDDLNTLSTGVTEEM